MDNENPASGVAAEAIAEDLAANVEAQIETALEGAAEALGHAEAKAAVADELNETIIESARRDALIRELEGHKEWLTGQLSAVQGDHARTLETLASLQSTLEEMREESRHLSARLASMEAAPSPSLILPTSEAPAGSLETPLAPVEPQAVPVAVVVESPAPRLQERRRHRL